MRGFESPKEIELMEETTPKLKHPMYFFTSIIHERLSKKYYPARLNLWYVDSKTRK